MTKLEEVARAIGAKRGDYSEAGWLGPETHAMALSEASAAIDALREPNQAQLNMAREWSYMKYGKPIGNDAAKGCWGCMLDALLNEEQPK
jgi:hypothetical protein